MAGASTSEQSFESLLTADQKNAQSAVCPRCKSVILRPNSAKLVNLDEPMALPGLTVKATGDVDFEPFRNFWRVSDPFAFENVGFTNTVQKRKYLTCADCEIGPLGYQEAGCRESFLALSRVTHEPDSDIGDDVK